MATEQTDKLEELTAANDDICPPDCECKYCWAEREIQSLRDELRQLRDDTELASEIVFNAGMTRAAEIVDNTLGDTPSAKVAIATIEAERDKETADAD